MKRKIRPYPAYAPTIWCGMRLGPWLELLARNRFGIRASRIPAAVSATFFAANCSLLFGIQEKIYRERIEAVEIAEPPIFILGLPRCGTTYMHEIVSVDERFVAPTTYQCLAVNMFLLAGNTPGKILGKLIPKLRPTDNVKLGWDRPQEDEFALLNMGLPSPFHQFGFPNNASANSNYLTMENLSEKELERWKDGLSTFFKMVLLQKAGRLVSKSPTHTGRIKTLEELFPGAKFVHMVRDPFAAAPSTLCLWETLCGQQGFQKVDAGLMEDAVFELLALMNKSYEEGRKHALPGNVIDVRYEDLIENPMETLRRVFHCLDLDGIDNYAKRLHPFLSKNKPYRPKPYSISPELKRKIAKYYAAYLKKYGYVIP